MGFLDRFRTPKVRAAEAQDLLSDRHTVLLDVREKNEWNAGHAPVAVHLPLSRVDEAPRRLRKDATTVLVVCRSGNRSRAAVSRLRALGIPAVNLRGGMRAWQAAGGAVVDRSGRPGIIA